MNRFAVLASAAAALLTAVAVPARADKPTREEIARRGKAAVALVQLRSDRIAGTAFCVHPDGYFLTADAVLAAAPADGEVTLVLEPGLKSQKILNAHLVRRDKDLGAALLRADGARDLPTLPLSSADKLTELEELVTLGFPYGARLDRAKPEYPSVLVDVCTVTAVNRKDGEPTSILMKGGANAVHPGGPALDENAAVAGLILASSKDGGRAVPVNRLLPFLAAPDFRLVAPALTRANLHAPAEFQVRLVSLFPPAKPWAVELVLRDNDGPQRRVKMELKDGVYRASAPPVSADEARRVELSAQFETGSVSGFVEDREVQVGARKVKLSALRRLQPQSRPSAVLAAGAPLEGVVTGLGKVDFTIGGQTVPIDLGRAASVQVLPPRPVAAVECTLIARQGDAEVCRYQTRLPVQGAVLVEPADLAGTGIAPAPLGAGTVVKTLPDIASDVEVGGGGRYLIFHLPKLKKLAVFDVNAAAIVRYLPLTEDKIVYAAGLEKVVVGLTARGVLERWDLATGEKELTRTVPSAADVNSVLMGSASHGPVVVNGVFYDLYSLKPLPIKTPFGAPPPWSPVSADGTVFGGWKNNQSPTESTSFVLQGDELKRYDEGGTGYVVPGPDGRVVYTAVGLRSNQLKPLDGAPKVGLCLPAAEGPFFLALTPAEGGKGGRIGVYMQGNDQPLVKDVGFEPGVHYDRGTFGPWKRIFFIPRAKLMVVFPESNDRLELHHFDVEEALEKSGLDYLLVTSRPPATAKRGAEYTYQMAVKSRKGGVKFQVATGPDGLEVSPTGLVKWHVPADYKGGDAEVLLTVRDASGQEVFHTFTIRITDE